MEKPTLLNVNLLNVKTSIRFKASVSFINVWQKYSSLKKNFKWRTAKRNLIGQPSGTMISV